MRWLYLDILVALSRNSKTTGQQRRWDVLAGDAAFEIKVYDEQAPDRLRNREEAARVRNCRRIQSRMADFLSIILIAIGLSADCFAVALSGGISNKNHSWTKYTRVALSFGVFQALMPIIGWLAGRTFVDLIASYDHWVAFGLLGFVGGKMVFEAFHHHESRKDDKDITKGWLLITLSVATSIDALAVGLSFAFLKVNILLASGIIGVTAFVITIVGFVAGRKAGEVIGKRAELLGGLILVAIGLRILVSHLTGGT
jgi:putative Mn2+ efflux pump MntP